MLRHIFFDGFDDGLDTLLGVMILVQIYNADLSILQAACVFY